MRLCETCKDIQITCCNDHPIIILTLGDIHRISEASGRNDFHKLAPSPQLSLEEKSGYDYDPNWLRYTTLPGDFIRVLKMERNGSCTFFGAKGCTLSEDTRPLICRLYPYSYNEYGLIGLVLDEDFWCPIQYLPQGENIFDNFQMPWEKAEQWRRMCYDELRAEYNERENNR